MDKKNIKKCLQEALKLHKKYTLDIEKLEKKIGGEIAYTCDNYAEVVYPKSWYSIDDNVITKHASFEGEIKWRKQNVKYVKK